MLEAGRRARMQQQEAPKTRAERRRKMEADLTAGDPAARLSALRALTLEDRSAAEAIARQRLGDPVLFVDCARLLLVSGAPDAKDLMQVRRILRTGRLDEPSRTAGSMLVLETLVRIGSPAAPPFAAELLRSPSSRIRAATPKVMVSMPENEQVPLLLGALLDRTPQVRQAARAQLTYVARKDLGDNPAAWNHWWQSRSVAGRKPAR
jgi:HEAT repeat protein